MATDYDAPRRDEVDLGEDSLEELKARRADSQSGSVDVDEVEGAESFELPGAALADEELTVKVLPMQSDEFRCARCFLVHHRSQLAAERNGELICRECAWPATRAQAPPPGRPAERPGVRAFPSLTELVSIEDTTGHSAGT